LLDSASIGRKYGRV